MPLNKENKPKKVKLYPTIIVLTQYCKEIDSWSDVFLKNYQKIGSYYRKEIMLRKLEIIIRKRLCSEIWKLSSKRDYT